MNPHITFLTNASHLLAQTSPQTSAHLSSHRIALLLTTTPSPLPLPDTHRQHACTACGHIFLPGQGGDTLTLRRDSAKKPASRPHQRRREKAVPAPRKEEAKRRDTPTPPTAPAGVSKLLKCGLCAATTVVKIPPPGRISRRSRKVAVTAAPQQLHTAPEAGKSASNANSKKRAKNRKAGLQALLDEKKKQGAGGSGGLGLSLADFMKK